MKRARGLTLVEVLVGLFLSSVLLTLLLQLFSVTYRVGQQEIRKASLRQGLMVIGQQLVRDLNETTVAGITLVSSGAEIATHPLGGITVGGRLVYEDRIWLWSWNHADRRLTRSQVTDQPFEGLPLRLTPDTLEAAERALSRSLDGVVGFSVSNPAGTEAPLVSSPLSVRIELENPETGETLTYATRVHLRMSGT